MNQEKKPQKENPDEKNLKWEKKKPSKGIFELLQPILGNFVLLIEEEQKRTLEQMKKTKSTLERLKNNR